MKLNPKQKKFADLYTSDEYDLLGNGTECYIEAYNIDTSKPNYYKSAAASASRLLKNAKVLEYINNKLEKDGLNNEFVDKQLRFLITQHADFKSKLGAIKEFNVLKQRIKKKVDKFGGEGEGEHITEYENLSDEELNEIIKNRENRISQAS